MPLDRRTLLKLGGLAALAGGLPGCAPEGPSSTSSTSSTGPAADATPADYTIRIGTGLVELAPDRIIATTALQRPVSGAADSSAAKAGR